MDETCIYAYQNRCCHSAHVGTEHPCAGCIDRRTTPLIPVRRIGDRIVVGPLAELTLGREWTANLELEGRP